MAVSRSAQAVLWLLEDRTRTHAEAAREFSVTQSTINRAWAMREAHGACPHCGQTMRQGDKPGGPKKEV